jgi:hypothetical protein
VNDRRGDNQLVVSAGGDVNNVVPTSDVPAALVTDSLANDRRGDNQLVVSDGGDVNNVVPTSAIPATPVADLAATHTASVTRGLTSLQALFGGNFSENKGNFNINVHYYNH